MKLLVVDDEAINRMVLCHYFEDKSFEVLSAKDGLDALKILKNVDGIDIVLLDLNMPIMDGYMLLRQLENDFFDTKNFKIIVISASLESNFFDKATELKLNLKRLGAFLGKPVNLELLYNVVKELISNGS